MSDTAGIRYDVNDGIAMITIDRPEKLNALTTEMAEAYTSMLRYADGDPDAVVVIVTGAGRAFCAGADLAALENEDGSLNDYVPGDAIKPEVALGMRKPVLAAVNGPVAGIGFAMMLAADIRWAAAGATITTSFARLGLIAEYSISYLLPRLVGPGIALDLLFSGRRITAEDAAAIGLVEHVVAPADLLPAVTAYARDLVDGSSPKSMASMKAQVYADLARPLDEALADSRARMMTAFGWPDLAEGVAAFRGGRQPKFSRLEGTQ